MPYKRVGKEVMKNTDGWHKKGKSSSAGKAKKYMRLLQAVEHGWKPTGKISKQYEKHKNR